MSAVDCCCNNPEHADWPLDTRCDECMRGRHGACEVGLDPANERLIAVATAMWGPVTSGGTWPRRQLRSAARVLDAIDEFDSLHGVCVDPKHMDLVAWATRPRRGVREVELQRVVDIYRANIDFNPTFAVFREMGYNSGRTAARRVEQARAAGLLPPTTQGRKRA